MSEKKELIAAIRQEIDATGGAIPFARFMTLALYHPQWGYYSDAEATSIPTGTKPGADFFTNVSVGPLFGELIGRRLLQAWEEMEKPAPFAVTEAGAMDGQLAVDVLLWAQKERPDFFAVTHYTFCEPIERNKTWQQKKIAEAGLTAKARWVSTLEGATISALISNELFDSFAVHRIVFRHGTWLESHVTWEEDQFVFVDKPISSSELAEEIKRRSIPEVEGYTTEINLAAARWLEVVISTMKRGIILTVDYGFPREIYYAPERPQGTLQAYRAHQRNEDLLAAVGQQDITAHVDFTTLIEAGEANGLRTVEFIDQYHFVLAMMARAEAVGRVYTPQEIRAIKTLMHPEMLGTRFQYLVQEK